MKRTLYCKNCKTETEQEHIERRLCICTCGEENYIGARRPKEIRRRDTLPTLPKFASRRRRGRPPALTRQQIEEAVRLHLARMKWAGIAARFGCSVMTVQKAVKKYV
jgi:hypothetical protein